MNVRVVAALGAALVFGFGLNADAQTFGHDEAFRNASPQNFAIELRFGVYNALIDTAFSGQTPYRDFFGFPGGPGCPHVGTADCTAFTTQNLRYMGGLEFDWQALRMGPVGSLSLGASVSYTNVSEFLPVTEHMMGNVAGNWVPSTEVGTIYVVPMTLGPVLRFDGIARAIPYVPLVPYVKLEVAYGLWWVLKGPHEEARGGSLGFMAAAGVSLLLDRFEPRQARDLDATEGVNHSYLFFELDDLDLSGFGNRPQLNVGNRNWSLGLMLEF